MALDVPEERHNTYFPKECSIERGEKSMLKTDAVPTVFTKEQAKTYSWAEKQELSRVQTKELVKGRSMKNAQQKLTVNDWEALNQKVLTLTLDIICLLTGEDYIVVKKTSNQHLTLSPTKKQSFHSMLHEKNTDQKILDLANKIIELLTGKVPIKNQDVSLHLSIEEKMDIGHKDLYKDIENHQNLVSSGNPPNETPPHICKSCPDIEKLRTDISSKFNHFNGRQFRNEFHNAVRNTTKVFCDDRSIEGTADQADRPSLYITEGKEEFEHTKVLVNEELRCYDGVTDCTSRCTSTSSAQHPDTYIKEKPVSWHGEQSIDNSSISTDHTYHMTTRIKAETFSCDEGHFIDYNSNTATINRQQCPTTHVTEGLASLDGVNFTLRNNNALIDHALHPSAIKEEPDPCDGEIITDPSFNLQINCSSHNKEPVSWGGEQSMDNSYMPTDHTYHIPSQIKMETFSSEDGPFIDYNSNTATDNRQLCPSTHITVGLALLDGVNITDPNNDTPVDYPQHPPTIKEELDLCDGENIIDPSFNLPTNCLCPHSKEPAPWDGEQFIDNNFTLFKDHTYHKTTPIKMESFSCDEGHFSINATTNNTQQYPTSHVKEEQASLDGVNLTDPTKDTLMDYTQHHPTIKEKPDSRDAETITDHYCNLPKDCSSHIKEEPVSGDEGNLTDPSIYTPSHTYQYRSIPVKEEPVSCEVTEMEYNTVSIKEEKKDVVDNNLRNTPRNPAQQYPSTCAKVETRVKPSPSTGQTGKKPNHSSLVRSIVLAHLLEMAQKEQSNTNRTRADSQGQPCAVGTSVDMHDFWESRLKYLSFKNNPEKTFDSISNLTKYLGANSIKKTRQCSQRGWYFLRRPQLQTRIKIHAGQNLFKCENCGKYFFTSDQLVEHQKALNRRLDV